MKRIVLSLFAFFALCFLVSAEDLPATKTSTGKPLKVAYFMPFALDETKNDSANDRFLEFYQGSLLAIEELKKAGVSFNVYSYDTGKDAVKLGQILSRPEIREMDIFIGPVYTSQIKKVSDYAKRFGIRQVVPFSSKSPETQNNPMLFQSNSDKSLQNEEAAIRFAERFGSQPITIITCEETDSLTSAIAQDLVDELKYALQERGIEFNSLVFKENNKQEIVQALASDTENMVVLGTSDVARLTTLIPLLKTAEKEFALFGMPDWQTINAIQEEIFSCKLYLYTPFYIEDTDSDVMLFRRKFLTTFGLYNQSALPYYNFYGYDTSLYFLSALAQYGTRFESKLSQLEVKTLQSTFRFECVGQGGGYINKGLFLQEYVPGNPTVITPF